MLDTLPAQIGGVFAVLVCAFVFWKGDEPERIGGGAFLLGWIASAVVQRGAGLYDTQWGLAAIDAVMLVVFAALAWKSRRAWPVWACALQSLIVMSHILTLVDLRPSMAAFIAVNNLASYGILVALGVGVLRAWQDRRAAGLE